MTKVMHLDIETFSSVDISSGVYKYAESEDFDILLFAYAYDDEPVTVLDLTKQRLPIQIVKDILSPRVLKKAHNAQFERICLSSYLKKNYPTFDGSYLSPKSWYCTMVHATMCGLPASLKQVGEALKLSEDQKKLGTGDHLIAYFCKPCKPTRINGGRTRNLPHHAPEKWNQFIEYNKRDVETEMEIERRLNAIIPISQEELNRYHLDQYMNDTGIGIDLDLVNRIAAFSLPRNEELKRQAFELARINVGAPNQIKDWIEKQTGDRIDKLTKDVLKELIDTQTDATVQKILEYRQELGKTSCKKYQTIQKITCNDGRVHGCLQFYGSRTGRWAGRLLQPQNLPSSSIDDLDQARALAKDADWELLDLCYPSLNEVFSSLIRTVIIPKEGCSFAVADYSAIEARVIAWLADERWRMQAFHEGKDIYCASASSMFGVPVEKHGVNSHLRKKGKIAELACGFQGGKGALIRFGADKLGLTETEMTDIITKWRKQSPNICRLWKTFDGMATLALKGTKRLGPKGITFEHVNGDLMVKLPSGRYLIYHDFGYRYEKSKTKDSLSFEGKEQNSHKWGTVFTYGGKMTENIVQAIARDCLAVAIERLVQSGYQPILLVHDEVIIEVPSEDREKHLKAIEDIMAQPIEWAKGLELKAAGFTADYYQKD